MMSNKEDRKTELLDNYWFGIKMINRGEATYKELKPQFEEIEKELNSLGYYKKTKRKRRKKNDCSKSGKTHYKI